MSQPWPRLPRRETTLLRGRCDNHTRRSSARQDVPVDQAGTRGQGVRLRLIRALGLEQPLLRLVHAIDRGLRRWPWLYRKLGGEG